MKLDINPRGNGACPLCVNHGVCSIQKRIGENVDTINPSAQAEMELVIYSCPYFKEKRTP